MKIVSFGTNDKYKTYVKSLRKNLTELDARHEIDLLPPFNSKKAACLYRPKFLLSKLTEPIIHTDVDTRFLEAPSVERRAPSLFWEGSVEYDVGIVRNSPRYSFSRLPFVVFVFVVQPTYGGWAFLDIWRKICEERWDTYDDHQRFVWATQMANSRFADLTDIFRGKVIKNGFAGKNEVFGTKI